MKIFSNRMTLVTLMFFSLITNVEVMAKTDTEADLWVNSGFPYKNLVQRYDQVKIHYSDLPDKGQVRCRVELVNDSTSSASQYLVVSQKRFQSKPLQSCIDRQHAIEALEVTYSE